MLKNVKDEIMSNFLTNFYIFSMMGAGSGDDVLNPIYNGIALVGPYVLGVVGVLSIFYGIFLGVKYARAEDEQTKANMQKTLINFIIGAAVVWVLLAILIAIRGPLARFID